MIKPTRHAGMRWRERAPIFLKSWVTFRLALRTAKLIYTNESGIGYYTAFGMVLVVKDGLAITVYPRVPKAQATQQSQSQQPQSQEEA